MKIKMTGLEKMIFFLEEALHKSAEFVMDATWDETIKLSDAQIEEIEEISDRLEEDLKTLRKFAEKA